MLYSSAGLLLQRVLIFGLTQICLPGQDRKIMPIMVWMPQLRNVTDMQISHPATEVKFLLVGMGVRMESGVGKEVWRSSMGLSGELGGFREIPSPVETDLKASFS